MYVDSSSITVNQKTYTRHLLRTSFRKDGKVKHRTIANISSCSDEEIQAVKLGLKYKGNLAELASLDKSMKLQQGLRVGAALTPWEQGDKPSSHSGERNGELGFVRSLLK